jgi:predicted RNA-binding protein with PUA-like domain
VFCIPDPVGDGVMLSQRMSNTATEDANNYRHDIRLAIAKPQRGTLRYPPPLALKKQIDMANWLMKSEPDVYSIDDLKRDGSEPWDGIRNYQARNMMRDDMQMGDRVFFYHSNCKEIGIVGTAQVTSQSYPDPTQFDPKSNYHDAKSSEENPRWCLVDVGFVRKLNRTITLAEIKEASGLDGLILTRKGNRLSIMPVSDEHWDRILTLE